MKKYDIVLANLDPTKGSEQKGTRPCLVLQNNVVNASRIKTVVVIPFTTSIKNIPWALILDPSEINGLSEKSRLELSQIRTIDRSRIIKSLGCLEPEKRKELQGKIILFFDLFDEF